MDAFVLRLFFACLVGKNPETPNLSPMADDAITWGGMRGLGSPLYICGQDRDITVHYTVWGGGVFVGVFVSNEI